LLKRAADAGRADAALDLAMSFDPSFVPNRNPDGATADPAEAARWYKRAIKLGRKDVAADLERVTSMIKNTAPQ
jgi:TPR repeat protein